MPDHEKLQALLAITRVLEEAVTNCEFELALRLQDVSKRCRLRAGASRRPGWFSRSCRQRTRAC
jgi:hypothetical protein